MRSDGAFDPILLHHPHVHRVPVPQQHGFTAVAQRLPRRFGLRDLAQREVLGGGEG